MRRVENASSWLSEPLDHQRFAGLRLTSAMGTPRAGGARSPAPALGRPDDNSNVCHTTSARRQEITSNDARVTPHRRRGGPYDIEEGRSRNMGLEASSPRVSSHHFRNAPPPAHVRQPTNVPNYACGTDPTPWREGYYLASRAGEAPTTDAIII